MTQNEKDLLLRDLCGRLPFNVRMYDIDVTLPKIDLWLRSLTYEGSVMVGDDGSGLECSSVGAYLPYLFPLSSMTWEQECQYREIIASSLNHYEVYDWLNKNHFDYRGLIEKGLAIDATDKNIY